MAGRTAVGCIRTGRYHQRSSLLRPKPGKIHPVLVHIKHKQRKSHMRLMFNRKIF